MFSFSKIMGKNLFFTPILLSNQVLFTFSVKQKEAHYEMSQIGVGVSQESILNLVGQYLRSAIIIKKNYKTLKYHKPYQQHDHAFEN